MSYNYEEMKESITKEMYEKVKQAALGSKKETLQFFDFMEGLVCSDSWCLLACIDKLIEDGIIKVTKQTDLRQDWEYQLVKEKSK